MEMPSITLIVALLACAGLGVLAIVRPAMYVKIHIGAIVIGALMTGYTLGVLIARTFFHQNWRLFLDDLPLLSLFYVLALGRSSRRKPVAASADPSAPSAPPSPLVQQPPAVRLYGDVPAEELQGKLLAMEEKKRQKGSHLLAQKDWLAGVEDQYQDLMGRFQDAKSDDERSGALESLRKITEDLDRARSEVRTSEQSLAALEREIRTLNALVSRQSQPR